MFAAKCKTFKCPSSVQNWNKLKHISEWDFKIVNVRSFWYHKSNDFLLPYFWAIANPSITDLKRNISFWQIRESTESCSSHCISFTQVLLEWRDFRWRSLESLFNQGHRFSKKLYQVEAKNSKQTPLIYS